MLIAIIMGTVIFSFTGFGTNIRRVGSELAKDLQATYFLSLRKSLVLRVSFVENAEGDYYIVERFDLPAPPPPEEDLEAFREWEKAQEEKRKAQSELSREELRNLSILESGEFTLVKKKSLGGLKLEKLLRAGAQEGEIKSIYFYPTGDMDDALIILKDEDNSEFSIVTEAFSGKIRTFARALTEEEWKKPELEE